MNRVGKLEYRQYINLCHAYSKVQIDHNWDVQVCVDTPKSSYTPPALTPSGCDDQYYDDQGKGIWAPHGMCRGYNNYGVFFPPDGVSWFKVPEYMLDDPLQAVVTPPDWCEYFEIVDAYRNADTSQLMCGRVYLKVYYGKFEIWEWSC